MKTEFMPGVTLEQAIEAMPWASVIVAVEGGYMGFESLADYQTWENQK